MKNYHVSLKTNIRISLHLLKFANFFIRLYENLKDTTNILFGHRKPFVAESIKGKSIDFGEKGIFDWATNNSNKVVSLI